MYTGSGLRIIIAVRWLLYVCAAADAFAAGGTVFILLSFYSAKKCVVRTIRDIVFVHDSFVKFQNPYISLITLGWEKCKPSHSCSGVYDKYIIHFIKSGKGDLLLNNELYHLKENDVFLIRPGQIAKYTADGKEPWYYSYFSFSGVLAPSFVEETVFKNNNSTYSMDNDDLFRIIIEGLEKIHNERSARISSLEYLFKLLSVVSVNSLYDTENKNLLVEQIKEYIEQNYFNDIQINEIAEKFNISRNYLFRIFKKENGMSLKKYILNIKFEEAKRLLLMTNLPVTQISEMVGFKSYSAFFKAFKSMNNCTPKKYREIIKHTNENETISKFSNGIYQIESNEDSIIYKNKYDTKI